jgi:hypothetical protein
MGGDRLVITVQVDHYGLLAGTWKAITPSGNTAIKDLKMHVLKILLPLVTILVFIHQVGAQATVSYANEGFNLVSYSPQEVVNPANSTFGITYDLAPYDPEVHNNFMERVTNFESWSTTVTIWDPVRVQYPLHLDPTTTAIGNANGLTLDYVKTSTGNDSGGVHQVDVQVKVGADVFNLPDVYTLGTVFEDSGGTLANGPLYTDPVSLSERVVLALLAGDAVEITITPVANFSVYLGPWRGEFEVLGLNLDQPILVQKDVPIVIVPEPDSISLTIASSALLLILFGRARIRVGNGKGSFVAGKNL